jgi:putative oxidoreductase
MNKKCNRILLQVPVFLLVLVWVYAATSKLLNFGRFEKEMHNQVLYPFVQSVLIYCLPATELFTALLLLFDRTLLKGLWLSLGLMMIFTAYIGLALLHFFRHVPCSCGGILENMSWQAHLYFNLFILALDLIAIVIFKRKEAGDKKQAAL